MSVEARLESDRPATAIEARGLVKRYREVAVVDGVDLTVRPGDIYGFLDPNGAGKTTTLRMLLALVRPDAGSMRLFGRDLGEDAVAALQHRVPPILWRACVMDRTEEREALGAAAAAWHRDRHSGVFFGRLRPAAGLHAPGAGEPAAG